MLAENNLDQHQTAVYCLLPEVEAKVAETTCRKPKKWVFIMNWKIILITASCLSSTQLCCKRLAGIVDAGLIPNDATEKTPSRNMQNNNDIVAHETALLTIAQDVKNFKSSITTTLEAQQRQLDSILQRLAALERSKA